MAERHRCEPSGPWAQYGPAVTVVLSDADGRLWAGNGEYVSQVNFCPVCGVQAATPVTEGDQECQVDGVSTKAPGLYETRVLPGIVTFLIPSHHCLVPFGQVG